MGPKDSRKGLVGKISIFQKRFQKLVICTKLIRNECVERQKL